MQVEQEYSSIPGLNLWRGLGTAPLTLEAEQRISAYIQRVYVDPHKPIPNTTEPAILTEPTEVKETTA